MWAASSKVKDVGELADSGPLCNLSRGAAPLIVDQEEITERFVSQIEAEVAGKFLSGAVVLDQRV